jgi:hypothetical protein
MGGAPVLMPLRGELGVRSFGLNCWTAPVGAPVIERHSEPDGDEEVYVVVRGAARFTVGEEIARDPERWQALYNAATFEALAGNADAAFAHLEHALALGPSRVRQLAATSAPTSRRCTPISGGRPVRPEPLSGPARHG